MTWLVDASDLVAALNNASDRIKTLHVVADDRINLEVDGRDDARRRLRRPPRRLRSRHPLESTSPKNETLRPNNNPVSTQMSPQIDADGVPDRCLSFTVESTWGHFKRKSVEASPNRRTAFHREQLSRDAGRNRRC